MKAVCWYGAQDVRVETVDDPHLLNPHDAIVKVTLTAICGSDLHLYNGYNPSVRTGDILGHEFMGEVVEIGPAVTSLHMGDRVVIPFAIACGQYQSQRCDVGKALSGFDGGAIRVFALIRRLCGRTGGICAGALSRRGCVAGAARVQ